MNEYEIKPYNGDVYKVVSPLNKEIFYGTYEQCQDILLYAKIRNAIKDNKKNEK
jgi:hypothetical protein